MARSKRDATHSDMAERKEYAHEMNDYMKGIYEEDHIAEYIRESRQESMQYLKSGRDEHRQWLKDAQEFAQEERERLGPED